MNGCKCAQCYGLAEYQQDHGRPNAGLPSAPGHKPTPLRLVQTNATTVTLTAPDVCDGTMTCGCDRCQQDRNTLIKRGGIGNGSSSPFKRAAA